MKKILTALICTAILCGCGGPEQAKLPADKAQAAKKLSEILYEVADEEITVEEGCEKAQKYIDFLEKYDKLDPTEYRHSVKNANALEETVAFNASRADSTLHSAALNTSFEKLQSLRKLADKLKEESER